MRDRSSDAEFILEGEEFDLVWTEEERPISWFRLGEKTVTEWDDRRRDCIDEDDEERIANIMTWATSRGGLSKAIFENPILAWSDGTVLDGTHRLMAANRNGLDSVTVLIGHRKRKHRLDAD